MGLRKTLNEKPAIGRAIAVVAIAGAIYFAFRAGSNSAPDSVERRSQMVTIRDTLTDDEWASAAHPTGQDRSRGRDPESLFRREARGYPGR